MNCLFCGHQLTPEPIQTCPGCRTEHEPVPPVSGVNHVSQMIYALEMAEAGELEESVLADVSSAFFEKFEKFYGAWNLFDQTLCEQSNSAIRAKFGPALKELDEALEMGVAVVELIESAVAGNVDALSEAHQQLGDYYRRICSASAKLLDDLKEFEGDSGKGLFNLPAV